MKISKSIVVGLGILSALAVMSLAAPFAQKALADPVPAFTQNPFPGAKYTLDNGKITTTIGSSFPGEQHSLTFSNTTAKPLVYTSAEKIFCAGPNQVQPNSPATITLTKAPSGATISGKLVAFYASAGGQCHPGDTSTLSIANHDQSTGGTPGLPATLTWNGATYELIDDGSPLYGLNKAKGSDCYGGSVILTNAAGTNGTAWVGLKGGGGTQAFQPFLRTAGASDAAVGLAAGCGFQSPDAVTAGYSGAVAGGKLSAATPDGGGGDDAAQADGACVFQTNQNKLDVALSWILCPVINGLSTSADAIDSFVESQLNFNTAQNLPESVHKGWAVFKDLTTIVIVIALLVMIISQAIGGGPFDAYTIRKLLPKLVAAVIIMQISWQLCIWLIQLSNDAGQSVAQLMAVPFGGKDALDLPSLLHRLGPIWAAAVGVGTTGTVITAAIFAGPLLAFGWPILLMALLLVFIAVFVALATLLIRNALIVLLVMLSPLAFLAWVLPGTESYWKLWKDNFTKLLIFFPLVMALIFAGRIFAWTAGNLGDSGGLDAIMVFLGFFAPYFFLPKSFKWGGGLLSSASTGIRGASALKKGQDAVRSGLMGRQKRNVQAFAKDLDPTRDGYTKVTRRNRFGIPTRYSGDLGRTMLWNVRAGRFIPSKRALASTIQEGEKWSGEEDAIAAARIKREKDKAVSEAPGSKTDNPTMTYKLNDDGTIGSKVNDNPTGRGKAALLRAIGSSDERYAGVAVEQAIKTGSWVEIFKELVPINGETPKDRDLQAKIKASGAEWFAGDDSVPEQKGKIFVRAYDVPRWNSKINSSEELYPQTLGKALTATPHIGNPEGLADSTIPARQARANASVDSYNQQEESDARAEGRAPELKQYSEIRPHKIQRVVDAIDGYMDDSNITSQSEAQYAEWARLARQPGGEIISKKFGDLLQRMADSHSPGALNALSQLSTSASMSGTLGDAKKGLLTVPGVNNKTLEQYVQEAQGSRRGAPAARVTEESAEAPAAATPAGRAAVPTDTGAGGGNFGGGGGNFGGRTGTGDGGTGGGGYGPIELRVDHDALAETITRAARRGVHQGLKGFNPGEMPQGPRPTDITSPGGVVMPPGHRDDETPPAPPALPPTPPDGGSGTESGRDT